MTAVGNNHFRIVMQNSNLGGVGNQVQCGFGAAAMTLGGQGQTAAQIICYMTQWLGNNSSPASSIQQVFWRATPASVEIPIPFPATEVAALVTAQSLPNSPGSAYGGTFGAGSASAIGTSIVMTERTVLAGRSKRGRHFLPFVAEASIDNSGQLIAAQGADMESYAYDLLLAQGPGATPFGWSVWSPLLNSYQAITTVQCQLIPSNLRSRRR